MSLNNPAFRCCVDNCKSVCNNKNYSFFSFPRDRTECRTWLDNIPKIFIDKDLVVSTNDIKVCAKHFTRDMFVNSTKKNLIPNAVPTIFEDENDEDVMLDGVVEIDDFKIDIEENDPFAEEVIPRVESDQSCTNVILLNNTPYNATNSCQKPVAMTSVTEENKDSITNTESKDHIQNFHNFKRDDFYKICRICFTDDIDVLLDIFHSKCLETTFVSMLDKNNNNNLSRFICENCTKDMIQCHNFAKQIHKSTVILTNVYNNLNGNVGIKSIKISKLLSRVLTIEDCKYQRYNESIKEQPLQNMDAKNAESVASNNRNIGDTDLQDEQNDVQIVDKYCEDIEKITEKKVTGSVVPKRSPFKDSRLPIYTAEDQLQRQTSPIRNKECDKYVADRRFNSHMVTHKGIKAIPCDACEGRPMDEHNLIRQKRLHTSQGPFLCDICGEGCSKKRYLTQHITTHTKLQEPIVCKLCDQQFPTKFDYRMHLFVMHGYQKRSGERTINNGKPATSSSLVCHICQKVCTSESDLVAQKRTTHGPKLLLPCSICEKRYTRKVMPVHVRTHTGEKPYKCVLCDKAFGRRTYLRNHMACVHRNERAFKCAICDKGFNLKHRLKEHLRIHACERFNCEHCEKTFSHMRYVRKHLRVVHDISTHPPVG